MGSTRLAGIVTFLLFLAGCGGGSDTGEQLDQSVIGKFVGANSNREQIEFVKQIVARIKEFEQDLLKLEQRATMAAQDAKGQLFLKIGSLRADLGRFKGELYVYGNSRYSGNQGKQRIERSWRSLRQSYQNVLAEFDSVLHVEQQID